jgi:rhodanese-related sulfurtransferase
VEHSSGFLAAVDDAKSRVKEIDLNEFQRMQAAGEKLVLIDVREDREWEAGHAQDAIHLSKGLIERDIERTIPDRSTTMVLYCGGGYRSALATDSIRKMGYENAISLDGGWKAWVDAGLPVAGGV